MREYRYDVRIPESATEVLNMLKRGSEKTGIKEGRLIVLYLANYAELTNGGLLPPLVSHVPSPSQNGYSAPAPESLMQERNSPDVAAFYLDDGE